MIRQVPGKKNFWVYENHQHEMEMKVNKKKSRKKKQNQKRRKKINKRRNEKWASEAFELGIVNNGGFFNAKKSKSVYERVCLSV